MDGRNTRFLLGWPIFRGYTVSFRECIGLLTICPYVNCVTRNQHLELSAHWNSDTPQWYRGPPCPHQPLPWIKSTLKIARYCPLVIQGFSHFFRVVSSDYGKPRIPSGKLTWLAEKWTFLKMYSPIENGGIFQPAMFTRGYNKLAR